MILFLEHLLFVVKVQGSIAEGYFSLMKGWHSETMGYQPAASGIYTAWISKMLRGARRNFPSRFAEREAHSVAVFQSFKKAYISNARKTAILGNNTMVGASCAVCPFSAVSTS